MPQLPKNGWLHRCAFCDTITSRTMTIAIKHRSYCENICLQCRPKCLETLLTDFRVVRVIKDTIGHMDILAMHESAIR